MVIFLTKPLACSSRASRWTITFMTNRTSDKGMLPRCNTVRCEVITVHELAGQEPIIEYGDVLWIDSIQTVETVKSQYILTV